MSDLIERLRALPWHEPAIAEAADEIERLTALLKTARCPNTDCQDGGIPHQVTDTDWEQEQCQWCYERDEALAAVDKGEDKLCTICHKPFFQGTCAQCRYDKGDTK